MFVDCSLTAPTENAQSVNRLPASFEDLRAQLGRSVGHQVATLIRLPCQSTDHQTALHVRQVRYTYIESSVGTGRGTLVALLGQGRH